MTANNKERKSDDDFICIVRRQLCQTDYDEHDYLMILITSRLSNNNRNSSYRSLFFDGIVRTSRFNRLSQVDTWSLLTDEQTQKNSNTSNFRRREFFYHVCRRLARVRKPFPFVNTRKHSGNFPR